MNPYRRAMERVSLSPQAHERIMDRLERGDVPPAPRQRRLQLAAAAASVLVLCGLALFGLWNTFSAGGEGGQLLSGTAAPSPSVTVPPSPSPSSPAVPTPSAEPEDRDERVHSALPPSPALYEDGEEYTLSLPLDDPFHGQPHSTPLIECVEWSDQVFEVSASIMPPKGYFSVPLTQEEMLSLLDSGNTGDVSWLLFWGGYDLTATAVYDGEGALWRLTLHAVDRENGHNSFSLTLRSGELPQECYVPADETGTEIHGVTVYGSRAGRYGWDGSEEQGYIYTVSLLSGEVGLRFSAYNMEEETAATLATNAANCFSAAPPNLKSFLTYQGEIPSWRSEALTLEEAYAEELGAYLPTQIPQGFSCESAWRELGQDRNYLSVCWTGYYTYIDVTVSLTEEPVEVTDVNEPERYDERLYSIPLCDSVPPEYREEFDDPVFRYEDLTPEVIEARMRYIGEDAGDLPGYRGNFSVLYGEDTLVRYSLKGLSPGEVCALLGLS